MTFKKYVAVWTVLGLGIVSCDKSFLHDIKIRKPATDSSCGVSFYAQGLTATLTASGVELGWSGSFAGQELIIERSTDDLNFVVLSRQGIGTTFYVDATAQLGQQYFYKVVSDEACLGNAPSAGVVMPPSAVTDISFNHVSTNLLELNFVQANCCATGFRIERKLATAPTFTVLNPNAPVAAGAYADAGLTAYTYYDYRVTVLNAVGESTPYSETVFTSLAPVLSWAGPPNVGAGCSVTIPGSAVFDSAAEPDAAFASAAGVVSGCAAINADQNGITCVLPDPPTPGPVVTSWTVVDSYDVDSTLTRDLDLQFGPGQRSSALMPEASNPRMPGDQALVSTCGNCSGRRGSLAVGDYHSCIAGENGQAYCWGSDFFGQLGSGTPDYQTRPFAACGGGVAPCSSGLSSVDTISQSFGHACVLTTTGTLKCWGDNTYGQLGDGGDVSRGYPMTVCATGSGSSCSPLTGVTAVETGGQHTCAIVGGGEVRCWGSNSFGQLGVGETATTQLMLPATVCASGSLKDANCVPLTGVVGLALSATSSCGLFNDGTVQCWGDNDNAQLGAGVDPYNGTSVVNPGAVCDPSLENCQNGWDSVVQVAAGSYHSCAIDTSGSVLCWGDNSDGQLGDGTQQNHTFPRNVCTNQSATSCVPLVQATQVAVGEYHSCAIAGANNQLWCWGYNYYGQSGGGDPALYSTDIQYARPVCASGSYTLNNCVPLIDVAEIALGADHSCARLTSGEVRCWGDNAYGQLGNGDSGDSFGDVFTPIPVCAPGAVWNGTICNNGGTHSPLQNVDQVSARGDHNCALVSGAVYCWGYNYNGQVGNGTFTTQHSPTQVCAPSGCPSTLTNISAIALGEEFSCARNSSNNIYCWGLNDNLQLGDGTAVLEREIASQVCASGTWDGSACSGGALLSNVIGLASGGRHVCALMTGGSFYCWGRNASGQLGLGVESPEEGVPSSVCSTGSAGTCVSMNNPSAFSLGLNHSCAIVAGALFCWGQNDSSLPLGVAPGLFESSPYSVCEQGFGVGCTPLGGVAQITGGEDHMCARLSGGGAKCWGYNYNSQLGNGDSGGNFGTPSDVCESGLWDGTSCSGGLALSGITFVEAGFSHTCALVSGEVMCWGDNGYGQLGDNFTTERSLPVLTCDDSTCAGTLVNAASLSAGDVNTCARMQNGTLKCWGYNTYGAVGNGLTDDGFGNNYLPYPVNVCSSGSGAGCTPFGNAGAVAVGSTAACAVDNAANVVCWGQNAEGVLGIGVAVEEGSPTAVCASGFGQTCTPLANVAALSAAGHYSCALLNTGNVKCWGDNNYGQLGNNGVEYFEYLPVDVCASGAWDGSGCAGGSPLAGVRVIAAGGNGSVDPAHVCAIMTDNTVKCWGANGSGQLGIGTTGFYEGLPSTVTCAAAVGDGCNTLTLGNVVQVAAGQEHTCALISTGQVKCWGRNDYGQLGDGSPSDSTNPVDVLINATTPLNNAIAIATGRFHSCALLDDSTVTCWGINEDGEIGNGLSTNGATAPSSVCASGSATSCVILSDVVAIAAGSYSTCALLFDGTARCWGYGGSGQIGDGSYGVENAGIVGYSRLNPATVCDTDVAPNCVETYVCNSPLGDLVAIEGGAEHFCALSASGSVHCWGDYPYDGVRGDGAGSSAFQCTATTVCDVASGRCGGAPAFANSHVQTCDVASLRVP